MARRIIGKVSGLARYPVKSMLGEQLAELQFTARGAIGDRAYALRELVTQQIASAKKFPRLFEFRATYDSSPSLESAAPVTIELPDGRKLHAEDPDASEQISEALGRKMGLERAATAHREHAGIDPATIFADVPVDQVISGLTAATMPDHFGLEKNSFFDTAVMHVIATGTLRHMAKLAAPGSSLRPAPLPAHDSGRHGRERRLVCRGRVARRYAGSRRQPDGCCNATSAALRNDDASAGRPRA